MEIDQKIMKICLQFELMHFLSMTCNTDGERSKSLNATHHIHLSETTDVIQCLFTINALKFLSMGSQPRNEGGE